MKQRKSKHNFFLNPYEESAFSKCPKCDEKTRIRKFPLVIHVEPEQMLFLNKQCRYCLHCDLIIVRKTEVESLLVAAFEQTLPDIIGNPYLVLGTLERRDWKKGKQNEMRPIETVERMSIFKNVWHFEISGGWVRDKQE